MVGDGNKRSQTVNISARIRVSQKHLWMEGWIACGWLVGLWMDAFLKGRINDM